MKELIQKLAAEAEDIADEVHGTLVQQDAEDISWVNIYTEKLAEVIVRECIGALNKAVYLATREDGEQAHIDVILLEHFGVDE